MKIEQQRRDFKRAQPALYAYIEAVVAAKVLDSAGDSCSGSLHGHGAANRVWAEAHRYRDRARAMREES